MSSAAVAPETYAWAAQEGPQRTAIWMGEAVQELFPIKLKSMKKLIVELVEHLDGFGSVVIFLTRRWQK